MQYCKCWLSIDTALLDWKIFVGADQGQINQNVWLHWTIESQFLCRDFLIWLYYSSFVSEDVERNRLASQRIRKAWDSSFDIHHKMPTRIIMITNIYKTLITVNHEDIINFYQVNNDTSQNSHFMPCQVNKINCSYTREPIGDQKNALQFLSFSSTGL